MTRDFPTGPLAERARAWLDAGSPAGAPPRLAATVQLLRDSDDGLEVFVLERAATMAFAPSVLVFPGGRVDPGDADGVPPGVDLDGSDWAQRLGLWARPQVPDVEPDDPAYVAAVEARPAPDVAALARSVVVAACRELFEETGVLLASPWTGLPRTSGGWFAMAPGGDLANLVGPVVDGAAMRSARRAVEARELAFGELLDGGGAAGTGRGDQLALRGDLLAPVARWVTPSFEPRRYDTFFFAAACPPGREPDGATSEAVSARWVRPADALADHARGDLRLLPPTVVALETLAGFPDVASALASRSPVTLVAPEVVLAGGAPVIRVHGPAPDRAPDRTPGMHGGAA